MSHFFCLLTLCTMIMLDPVQGATKRASAVSPIKASDYCMMLQAVASQDPLRLYSYEMAAHAEQFGILQISSPEGYTYTVIPGQENQRLLDLSSLQQKAYFTWIAQGAPQNKEEVVFSSLQEEPDASPLMMVPLGEKGITREESHSSSRCLQAEGHRIAHEAVSETVLSQPLDEISDISDANSAQTIVHSPPFSFPLTSTSENFSSHPSSLSVAEQKLQQAQSDSAKAASMLDIRLRQWEIWIALKHAAEKKRSLDQQHQESLANWSKADFSMKQLNDLFRHAFQTKDASAEELFQQSDAAKTRTSELWGDYLQVCNERETTQTLISELESKAYKAKMAPDVDYGLLLEQAQKSVEVAAKNLEQCQRLSSFFSLQSVKSSRESRPLNLDLDRTFSSQEEMQPIFQNPSPQDSIAQATKEAPSVMTPTPQDKPEDPVQKAPPLEEQFSTAIPKKASKQARKKKNLLEKAASLEKSHAEHQDLEPAISSQEETQPIFENPSPQDNVVETTEKAPSVMTPTPQDKPEDPVQKTPPLEEQFNTATPKKASKRARKKKNLLEKKAASLEKPHAEKKEALFQDAKLVERAKQNLMEESHVSLRAESKDGLLEIDQLVGEHENLSPQEEESSEETDDTLSEDQEFTNPFRELSFLIQHARSIAIEGFERTKEHYPDLTLDTLFSSDLQAIQTFAHLTVDVYHEYREAQKREERTTEKELGYFEQFSLLFKWPVCSRVLTGIFTGKIVDQNRECDCRTLDYYRDKGKDPRNLEFLAKAAEIQETLNERDLKKAAELLELYPDDRERRISEAKKWGEEWKIRYQQERHEIEEAREREAEALLLKEEEEKVAALEAQRKQTEEELFAFWEKKNPHSFHYKKKKVS